MPQPTFFVPVAFARTAAEFGCMGAPQDPQSTGDAPSTTTTTPAGGGQGNTQLPNDPNAPKPQQQPLGPCADSPMLWLALLVPLGMLIFTSRGEKKRRQEQQALLASIKVDDKVVTAGGMHGTVARLAEKTVTLRVGSTEVTFDRTAIARVERGDGTAKNG